MENRVAGTIYRPTVLKSEAIVTALIRSFSCSQKVIENHSNFFKAKCRRIFLENYNYLMDKYIVCHATRSLIEGNYG